jgi:hypothetical protein
MLTKATASVKATQAKNTDTVEASRSMAELPLLPAATVQVAPGSLKKR